MKGGDWHASSFQEGQPDYMDQTIPINSLPGLLLPYWYTWLVVLDIRVSAVLNFIKLIKLSWTGIYLMACSASNLPI